MFIYVMDKDSRDYLLARGYELLKHNGSVWVFVNKSEICFDTADIPCVVSDVLTF